VLIHELVGHALEADTVLANASWLASASRGEIFSGSPELSVIDDPRRSRAAWSIDDEAVAARAVALMCRGQVSGWLHDRATSTRSGCDASGHGRRASFREPVRPRMGCTFLAPGKFDSVDALKGVERGIYVRRMETARTDTRGGRAVFRVSDADCIRGGRTEGPLAPHLIVVDAREALSSVECVANDLAFDVCVGSCLHHGQPLAISVGGPTFRIGLTPVSF
jgi:TldD protein